MCLATIRLAGLRQLEFSALKVKVAPVGDRFRLEMITGRSRQAKRGRRAGVDLDSYRARADGIRGAGWRHGVASVAGSGVWLLVRVAAACLR